MNKAEQLLAVEIISQRVFDLIKDKGDDYANEDRLSNFKDTAVLCGTTPMQVCLNQIGIKIARIVNLLEKPPKNESLADSLQDLITYSYLLKMIYEDTDNNNDI